MPPDAIHGVMVNDRLSIAAILPGLRTKWIGQPPRAMILLEEVGSTQTVAMEAMGRGAEDGTVVLAEGMTAGRGRLGRVWYAPPGVNIYCTVILRPTLPPARLPLITLMAAVSTVQAVREVTGVEATIKWPNDILVGGLKAGGILTEAVVERDSVRGVALGIGLNVNMTRETMPQDLRETATSLREASGRAPDRMPDRMIDRTVLLRRLLETLENWSDRLAAGDPRDILQAWAKWSETLGRQVKVITPQRIVTGRAHGVTGEGALILIRDDGTEDVVTSGDVIHLRPGEVHAARD